MGISPAAPSHIRLGEQRQRLHEVFSLQQGSSDASAVPLMPPMSRAAQDVFTMIPGGVISGRVLDSMGNPLVSAPLVALMVYYEDGRRVLRPGRDAAVSDDRGNFRLFGLRPGEYYVRVDPRQTPNISSPVARAYFPGVSAVTDAVPIVVSENGESPGANFSIPFAGTVKISGRVVGPGDWTRSNIRFYLLSAGLDQLEDITTIAIPSRLNSDMGAVGEFELHNVPPGHFSLYAVAFDNVQMRSYSGRSALSVGTQDYRDVSIEMQQSGALKGRLVFEDGTPVRRQMNLRPRETQATLGRTPPPQINVNTDGTFVMSQVPAARYSVTLNSTDACVIDIRQGGMSVYDSGFIGGVDAGTVQVQIVDDRKQTVSNAFVSLSRTPMDSSSTCGRTPAGNRPWWPSWRRTSSAARFIYMISHTVMLRRPRVERDLPQGGF